LNPLLAWARISTDVLLNAIPGAPLQTGVTVLPDGVWVLQLPVRSGGRSRNVRIEAQQRLPTQLTVALPLFWAILLAAPRSRKIWRVFGVGTAVLLTIPPIAMLI